MSFQRLSVPVLGVVCSSVCPCLPVVCLTGGKIFKIEKQMTWHKLTNPLLSPSAPPLCTCKYARFRLFVVDVPPVSLLHLHNFLHIPTFLSYTSSSTSSSSFFTLSSFYTSARASPLLHPPHPPPNPSLPPPYFHLYPSPSISFTSPLSHPLFHHLLIPFLNFIFIASRPAPPSHRPCATSLHLFSQ